MPPSRLPRTRAQRSMRGAPTLRAQRLARQLQMIAEDAGMPANEVAESVGVSPSLVSKWYSATTVPNKTQLLLFCTVLRVDDALATELMELQEKATEKGVWVTYENIVPEGALGYFYQEEAASNIWTVGIELVPGLLQTRDYYSELLRSSPTGHGRDDIELAHDLRQQRQERLLAAADAPNLHGVLSEAALHRQVGGPGVMRAQLSHLLEMAKLPNVTLQVHPFSQGAHPSMDAPFTYLSLRDDALPPVVYVESGVISWYIEKAGQVDRYVTCFQELADQALTPDATAVLIKKMQNTLRD